MVLKLQDDLENNYHFKIHIHILTVSKKNTFDKKNYLEYNQWMATESAGTFSNLLNMDCLQYLT